MTRQWHFDSLRRTRQAIDTAIAAVTVGLVGVLGGLVAVNVIG
jgi:hypothetical protein